MDVFTPDYANLIDPDNWWKYSTEPFSEQISVANKIAQVLDISFPVCSAQFTRASYAWFIKNYYKQYEEQVKEWLETNEFVSDVEFLS